MEQPLSSIAFRGSIMEAITEAKRQKKLFVVYISGDNPDSKNLETSTWVNPNVCETLAKYCILVHILEGSPEASQFSAIYPQHSAPCTTAVGYNGVQLWQKEGFVSADVLTSTLEKAWLSLHFQDTTAAFLTAALASGKQLATGTSSSASSESPSTNNHIPSINSNNNDDVSEERVSKQDEEASPKPSLANVSINGEFDDSASEGNTFDPVEKSQNKSKVANPIAKKDLEVCDNHLGSSNEVSQEIVNEASKAVNVNAKEVTEVEKADALDVSATKSKSNDVSLNIRMPDGISLQVKFSVMDTLQMVKDYIIENKESSLGSFSIAIPYPRKVFSDQDLDRTLAELDLFNRQALIVVPNNQSNTHYRGETSQYQTSSSNDVGSNASEGYWGYLRRILSYVNPFSYLLTSPRSSSAAQESQNSTWEYAPNPSLQNSLRDEQSTMPRNSNNKSRQQTSRFGANIHTLKHDDDEDSRFNDRNTFWNGNSTQFGGNDDEK